MALLVENLESLAPEDLSRLTDAGITDLGILLARLARVESREQLCSESGISLDELFRLAKIADIMRIQGVNEGHARLMISAGVGSVAALRACDAPLLLRQLRRMNVELLYLRSLPPESTINRWIEDARSMPDGLIS